jgi:hypothetical protein
MIVPFRYLSRSSFDTAVVGHVQHNRFNLTDIPDLYGRRSGLLSISRREQNRKSLLRELGADLEPNATVCSGDQCDASAFISHSFRHALQPLTSNISTPRFTVPGPLDYRDRFSTTSFTTDTAEKALGQPA